METLFAIESESENQLSADIRQQAITALEDARIVHLPHKTFELTDEEREQFMDPAVVKQPRNHTGRARIIYEPPIDKLRCSNLSQAEADGLKGMLARYAHWARDLVVKLFPPYEQTLELGPTTFRPCQRTGPQGLHIDSFFFIPTEGKRVLRIFTNINPAGEPRVWQVGSDRFEPFALRLMPKLKPALPGSGWILEKLHITKGRRTPYDHAMRQLRNLTKRDKTYQREAAREKIAFPSGSSWIVFTDGILHGALTGQYAFEQTFLLDVKAMQKPAHSPLRTLERLTGRTLA